MQLYRPRKERRTNQDEILAVLLIPTTYKPAKRRALIESVEKQLRENCRVIGLPSDVTLELYSRRPTNLVIEREIPREEYLEGNPFENSCRKKG